MALEKEAVDFLSDKILKLEQKLQAMEAYVATMLDCIENLQKITIKALRGLK